MSTFNSFVREVEQAISSGDPDRRARTLRQMTELFVEHASKLKDDHVSLFDEVIIRLAREVDAKARGDLSNRLADISNAPISVVKDLAYDPNVAVAEPVLERSVRLTEDDLMDVAGKMEQGHLLAMSRRRTLSERVADVLVKRGNQQVAQTVAQNDGAKLSKGAIATLVEKAGRDNSLRSALLKRLDPSGDRVPAPAGPPAPEAEEASAPSATTEMQRMEAALTKLAAAMTGATRPLTRDLSPVLSRIGRTAKGRSIEEVRVAAWIKNDKIDDALAAIAHNADLTGDTVARSFEVAAYEPLLLVVRAAGFSWNTFKLLLTSKDGKVPSADVVSNSFESFQQFSVSNAQQLARFFGSREAGVRTHAA